MPSFEELPVPGQNEYRARRGELADADHPEGRRLTLLQRLAAVGLGRREEDQKPDGRSAEPAKAPRKGSAGYSDVLCQAPHARLGRSPRSPA
jgi:cell division protein FtsZ